MGQQRETISHGTNGFLLASGDLAGLGPLLIKLHQDREQLQQMALAACATYISRPRWQDSIAAIDTFLREMKGLQDRREITGRLEILRPQDKKSSMQQDNYVNSGNHQAITDDTGKSFDPRYLAAKKSIDDRALNHHVWETLQPDPAAGSQTVSRAYSRAWSRHRYHARATRLIRDLLTGPSTYLATDMDPRQLGAARQYLSQWAKKHGHAGRGRVIMMVG